MSAYTQLNRFEKYSTLLFYYCDTSKLHKHVAEYFNRKIVAILVEREIFDLYDFISLERKEARELFANSSDFKKAVEVLYRLCISTIPNECNLFSKDGSFLLIKPFHILDDLIHVIGTRNIDFKYTNYSNIKTILNNHNIESYSDLQKAGIKVITNISGLGGTGFRAVADRIDGEKARIETGVINHTKKWNKKDSKFDLNKILKDAEKTFKKAGNKKSLGIAYKTILGENGEFYTIPVPVFPMKKAKKKKTKTKSQPFSLYALASGKPGKKFTIKQFLEITKSAKKKPGGSRTDLTIKLSDGYIYEADSKQEVSILRKLIKKDAFLKLRGQCINIPYRFAGENHNYYPDFIILTKTNRIVIMEAKEIVQMNVKQNLRKYSALKRYCERNGYLYIMCDKSFTPFEKLPKKSSLSKIDNAIEDAIDEKGYFDYYDYQELTSGCNTTKIKSIRRSIGIYIASNNDIKMNGGLTHDIRNLRIFRKK